VGPLLDNTLHSHHAIQVSVGLEGNLRVQSRPGSAWRSLPGVITAADQPHRMACAGVLAQIYLDPEGDTGRRLFQERGGRGLLPIPESTCTHTRALLRASCMADAGHDSFCGMIDEITRLVDSVAEGQRPEGPRPRGPRPLDARVARATKILRSLPERRLPLSQLAAEVHLSAVRLAHIFPAEIGLPVRRYLLWLRLIDAIEKVALGADLTSAAHDAGFSDSAHLTRTFRRMFGMPPSALKAVEKYVQAPGRTAR
jgi:AraC family transcriptional regulator